MSGAGFATPMAAAPSAQRLQPEVASALARLRALGQTGRATLPARGSTRPAAACPWSARRPEAPRREAEAACAPERARAPARESGAVSRAELAEFRDQLTGVLLAVGALEAERNTAVRVADGWRRRLSALEAERGATQERLREVAEAGRRQVEELSAERDESRRAAQAWRSRALGEGRVEAPRCGPVERLRALLAKGQGTSAEELRQAIGEVSAVLQQVLAGADDAKRIGHEDAQGCESASGLDETVRCIDAPKACAAPTMPQKMPKRSPIDLIADLPKHKLGTPASSRATTASPDGTLAPGSLYGVSM